MELNSFDNFVLLETLHKDRDNNKDILFINPVSEIICFDKSELALCFNQIEERLRNGFFLAGFFSYELGYMFEETFNVKNSQFDYPLIWMGVFEKAYKKSSTLNGTGDYYFSEPQLLKQLEDYKNDIYRIKQYITRGETYQINYTSKYNFNFFGNPIGFYNRLKEKQKVSYTALIRFNNNYIISLSPELFFRIDKKGKITVKPMKGTAKVDVPLDWLSNDLKSKSENVMIVDLLRNDLGRICKPGTVTVEKLFEVEKYSTLQQMTSTISGELKPGIGINNIIRSLFPCGSVTGAPKIRSMKIIAEIEKEQRNIYTGAIGYFSPDGQAVFNVAIRTISLLHTNNKKYFASMGVGSGIVFDSNVNDEYEECRLKAKFLLDSAQDFSLIETMLFTNGRIKNLLNHLKRFKKSADFFSIPCNIKQIELQLNKLCVDGTSKIRLLLSSKGDIKIEHQPFSLNKPKKPLITISDIKTDSQNVFLYHKTTHRDLYNQEYRKFTEEGYFDVIFMNEQDEITEGAISNIFILKEGVYYTPPLKCGLLNGVERQDIIKKYSVQEKVLFLKDLQDAEKIILTNSVRGETAVFI